PFQSGHFHPLPVWTFSPPSSPDTFTPSQSGHFHPLPVRTFSPPPSLDTFTPFQSGHFHPLPVRTLSPPPSPDTFTPFQFRPIFSFQRCRTLNDNCAVMQHCTHMKFFAFF
ncbi:unnamed protein product, partial [Staurois parvus]